MTLSAQIKTSHIEAVHFLTPEGQKTPADAEMSSNSIKAQTFIDRSFAALQDLLQTEPEGSQSFMLSCFAKSPCTVVIMDALPSSNVSSHS